MTCRGSRRRRSSGNEYVKCDFVAALNCEQSADATFGRVGRIATLVTSDKWTFSIPEHTRFLAGYMDAVGRALTSDSELISLSARVIEGESEAETILGVPLGSGHRVENWSREFGGLVENVLCADQRSRLGFYLIEYVCCSKSSLVSLAAISSLAPRLSHRYLGTPCTLLLSKTISVC